MLKYIKVSNPGSGFTITFDKDSDTYLGSLGTMNTMTYKMENKSLKDRRVFMVVKPNPKGKFRIVTRNSSNENAQNRIVDRINNGVFKKVFPVEFGPTAIPYVLEDGALKFTVPALKDCKPPITRTAKIKKVPLLSKMFEEHNKEDSPLRDAYGKAIDVAEFLEMLLDDEKLASTINTRLTVLKNKGAISNTQLREIRKHVKTLLN